MRVLFVFHMPSIQGGASKSGLALVRGLRDRGVQVMAVCPDEGSMSQALRDAGIPVRIYRYDWAYPYFKNTVSGWIKYVPKVLLSLFRNRRAVKDMYAFASEFRPDVVHTNTGVVDVGLKVAGRLGVPHVSHFREFGWKDCNAPMLHEPSMRRYSLQYGIAIGRDIMQAHSLPSGRCRLVYNGIINSGSARVQACKAQWFLFVGVLFKKKGIEDLLNAYALLPERLRETHRMRIAGTAVSDEYQDYLYSLADSLGISATVDWLGERDDVADLMYQAKALVVPSHHEAFGRIVVEAMANGCLVIGRDCDGIKEQFDNGLQLTSGEIGLRFDSVEGLSGLLRQVAETETDAYMPMIERARFSVESLYTVEGYVDSVASFYNKILAE